MKDCIQNRYMDYLPSSRIRRELDELFKINDYKRVIMLLCDFNFLITILTPQLI
ncbi:hypothetical protein PL321_15045 [Caloramator sp. mosi_1]|uniref:hypothetical protein n=1 Tax=Caloramator sp. mosi_1 TaxID=3023090 RepID=UPI0023606CCD|nr:hypothetical protein [Caloramator sp. mosi_1]WDC83804.1 hypothetical protein PL321_15045 [Caloramator sp. mosi_1]